MKKKHWYRFIVVPFKTGFISLWIELEVNQAEINSTEEPNTKKPGSYLYLFGVKDMSANRMFSHAVPFTCGLALHCKISANSPFKQILVTIQFIAVHMFSGLYSDFLYNHGVCINMVTVKFHGFSPWLFSKSLYKHHKNVLIMMDKKVENLIMVPITGNQSRTLHGSYTVNYIFHINRCILGPL